MGQLQRKMMNGALGPTVLRGDQGGGHLLSMHNTGRNPQGIGLGGKTTKTKNTKDEDEKEKSFENKRLHKNLYVMHQFNVFTQPSLFFLWMDADTVRERPEAPAPAPTTEN